MNTCRFVPPFFEPALAVVCVATASTLAAATPLPTPTPKQSALSAYAGRISLKRPQASGDTETIVISSETVAELSRSGRVIDGGVVVYRPAKPAAEITGTERSRWQARVRKQRAAISELERRRARIEKEIDLVNKGRLTPRALARIERAEVDLDFVDQEIRSEYLELARIIREARQRGAEPGWFR
jgi:hypothetical protein